ncbi:hypothetical protein TKK_0018319, partial [Trichogramma kaykai]
YYQPAGPLIQHPPQLPPVKGPPPDSTPTPPQNSEGSDDHVGTSTTSGGTSSTGVLNAQDFSKAASTESQLPLVEIFSALSPPF